MLHSQPEVLEGSVGLKLEDPAPERALERSLDELRPRLRGLFAFHRIPPEDAEDILQQTLLAYLYRHESVQDFDKWLLGAVRKRCLMYWRGRRRRFYTAIDAAILDELAEQGVTKQDQADFQRDLSRVVGRLSGRCRELLQLRFGLGYDPPEAARRLGYQPSGIYKTLERCLAALAAGMTRAGLMPRREPPTE
ncbi:MAG: RNA polymerase sigma factor [Thermoanaerobaculia bacterium]